MNKILIGTLIGLGIAGLAIYLSDPEKFTETVGNLKDNLKDKASQGLKKMKENVSQTEKDFQTHN